jgi:anaerobic magnesium-protoporphyrin IX monomethyl ester cyclase
MKILLVIYDNDSQLHNFPIGLGYIAAVLKKHDYEVEIYQQDLHHYPEEHLTKYLDDNHFDVVGLSIIGGYYQYQKCTRISDAINRSKDRPFYVLGGHGPAAGPDFFLNKMGCDVIVIGEGENTVINLFKAIENKRSLAGVRGIAYLDDGKLVESPREPLIKDIDSIPFPAFELFAIEYYRLLKSPNQRPSGFSLNIISGRGCTFKCNFCYRMDNGFRARSSSNIIAEIELLKKDYGITWINFHDELLMSSEKRATLLCEDFIKANLNISWTCNGRLNYARPKLLDLMKRAGCVCINYGIEAFDDQILKNMNKHLTTEQIVKGIEATLEVGITPSYNVIFGNIGENEETLQKGVDFLLKYDEGSSELRTIRPVTPYPGSPLFYYAIEKGFLKDCQDFYENKHTNSDLMSVNFTDLSDDEFHKALLKANTTLLENYFKNKMSAAIETARNLYLKKNSNFRGFR